MIIVKVIKLAWENDIFSMQKYDDTIAAFSFIIQYNNITQ